MEITTSSSMSVTPGGRIRRVTDAYPENTLVPRSWHTTVLLENISQIPVPIVLPQSTAPLIPDLFGAFVIVSGPGLQPLLLSFFIFYLPQSKFILGSFF
jgi:hypothetical protein